MNHVKVKLTRIFRNWFLSSVRAAFEKHPKMLTPSIRLAHINILSATTQHASGLQWIKTTKQWKITYYQDSHTVYVMRAAHEFVYTALVNYTAVPNCDDELCVEILTYFMAILLEHPWSNPGNIVVVDDEDIKRRNLPMLNLICYMLEKCIESQKRSRIVFHILITQKFEMNLWKLAEMSHDQQFLGHVLRAFVFSNFARFSSMDIPAFSPDTEDLPLEKFVLNFYNYMNFCILRRSSRNIIVMAEMNHMLWKKLGDRAPMELMTTHKIKFGDQVLLLQLLPIIYVIKTRQPTVTDREYLDEFTMKLFKISCEFTIRLMYSFRDLLRTNADNIADLACKSIQGILAVRESLSRERAIIVFQALVFIMKEFTPDICVAGEKAVVDLALLNEIPNLLSAILTGLYELIKVYRLTWNECLETTTVVNFMLAFLNNPNLSTRVIDAISNHRKTKLNVPVLAISPSAETYPIVD
jgi:BRCA1-associated ATM activator 1